MGRTGHSYRPGTFWRICDQSGFTVRDTHTSKQWDNLIVRRQSFDIRHPQQFVKGVRDNQNVQLPRPQAPFSYIGIQTTISSLALQGATIINVTSTIGMTMGDPIAVLLDNEDVFNTIIVSIGGGFSSGFGSGFSLQALRISAPLLFSTSPGNFVQDLVPNEVIAADFPVDVGVG